ncbi:MAG: VIT family protein [Patescibacteria group bacterium]|nr:VIT family protein [Patescibacteria group bacterium]
MATETSSATKMTNAQLNRLRAAVLGANDGIVSVSSIILGVAGATSSRGTIFTAGMAGLVAGALSMGVGEYVSVGSQRDTEDAYIAIEKKRLRTNPEEEFEELAATYEAKGMSVATAHQVAKELTASDPIKAHIDAELNLDEADLNSPVQAALASLISFTAGGLVPLLAVLSVRGHNSRIIVTFLAVLVALTITGYLSATVGKASRRRSIIRIVIGGALAMGITFLVGRIFGTAIS